MPEMRVVFPEPSSPLSAIQSPGFKSSPTARPKERVSRSPRRRERISAGTARSAPGRARRDREDQLLERDPAVLEAPPVLALVLVKLGGVDEVEVLLRQDVLLVHGIDRESEARGVLELDRLLRIAAQVGPELEAEVGRGF